MPSWTLRLLLCGVPACPPAGSSCCPGVGGPQPGRARLWPCGGPGTCVLLGLRSAWPLGQPANVVPVLVAPALANDGMYLGSCVAITVISAHTCFPLIFLTRFKMTIRFSLVLGTNIAKGPALRAYFPGSSPFSLPGVREPGFPPSWLAVVFVSRAFRLAVDLARCSWKGPWGGEQGTPFLQGV